MEVGKQAVARRKMMMTNTFHLAFSSTSQRATTSNSQSRWSLKGAWPHSSLPTKVQRSTLVTKTDPARRTQQESTSLLLVITNSPSATTTRSSQTSSRRPTRLRRKLASKSAWDTTPWRVQRRRTISRPSITPWASMLRPGCWLLVGSSARASTNSSPMLRRQCVRFRSSSGGRTWFSRAIRSRVWHRWAIP